ncbi:MAG TPA: hypothetical protein VGN41_10305 [Streptosporangiaceae bacterium]
MPAVSPRLVWTASFLAAAVLLFLAYLRLSRTAAVTADFASVAVMAHDMLNGNLLLHGWMLTDVSFYATELPQYMAVEFLHGYGPDAVHVAAAMTYTLNLLLAALLAKGDARGRQALARMVVAGGIMLAPQIGEGANILLLSPDHFGTEVPLLLVWLLIDRARPRWYVPVAAGLVLAAVQVGDRIAAAVAIAPLVIVCGARAYAAVVQRREPLRDRWYELSLAAAGILALGAASAAAKLMAAHGGFLQQSLPTTFAPIAKMPAHIWGTIEDILGLYGADFFNRSLSADAAFIVLHLVGVAVACWGLWRAARHLRQQDLSVQIVTVAIVVNLAVFTFSVLPGAFWQAREISGVLPLGAVLAGRLAADRIVATRLAPALAVVLLGYVFSLGHTITQPMAPAYASDLSAWLVRHHLSYGLAEYPQVNTVTLDSGGQVQMLDPQWPHGIPVPGDYQTKLSWYDAHGHDANFVVAMHPPGGNRSPIYRLALAAFGPPARTYNVGDYTVMTWNKNLLTYFGPPPTAPATPGAPPAS